MKILNKLVQIIKNPIDLLIFITKINKSYSQTGEDLILKHIINKKKGFFIDLGANDPMHYNNTYYFYKQGWTGINVEPNKKLIKKFHTKRKKDLNLNIAVGKGKELEFYLFEPHTLSTCDFKTAQKYKKMGHKQVDQYLVPVMGLSEIIKKYCTNKEIDILSIDVEGYDLEILKTNNWDNYNYKPKFIIIETIEYRKKGGGKKLNYIYDPYFKKIGYEKIAETYINTIYKLSN